MLIQRPVLAVFVVALIAASGTAQAQTEERGRGRAEEIRFRSMDADNDGVVTRAEWRGSAESFRQNDTNRDGVLSGGELAPTRPAQVRGRLRDERVAQFARADRDRDNRLDDSEWTADLGSFEEADLNADKVITRAEFLSTARSVENTDTPATVSGPPPDLRRGTPAFDTGFERGLTDGRQAGKEDRTVNGGKWDLEGQRELEQADAGYETRLGRREDYQAGFRAGFRRGYAEGFGPR
jgi:hypothetical protein